ncbi:OB-fold protein [Aquimarina algiphila]|uniref:OB-fold protein n=1 Tax=Aquimarina algiphila TaxID=2047982 RepID=UPI002490DDEA|nr:hypothetical protein [Aquimarina algiphila]
MKKLLIAILVIALAGFIGYKYIHQSHRDIQSEEANFTVNATDIAIEFSKNQDISSEKYLNKTIIVEGELTEIEENSIMLNEAVYSSFDTNVDQSKYTLGMPLKIKGRCIGYDELLEVIKLDQTSILE